MKQTKLDEWTVDQLVERFATTAREQNEALLMNDISKVNRLFDQLEAIEQALKARDGDQRRALLRLYDDPNAQVRLKAVKATLAVEPEMARKMLQKIAISREFPQAGEAGMSIRALDDGVFKPT
jgi:hypothetical protein